MGRRESEDGKKELWGKGVSGGEKEMVGGRGGKVGRQ
jgi:hypothetical protein